VGAGQIVLISLDGNVALSDAAGASLQTVTTDANIDPDKGVLRAYTYPVFSGDAKSLAFVGYATISGTDTLTQTLFVAPAAPKANLTRMYTTTNDSIPYVDWSPDNKTIAFLTISAGKGAMRVVTAAGGQPTVIEEGSSVYWHWRSDSTTLLAHLSGSPATNADAHISIVDIRSNQPAYISSVPGNFKAPHYSPDSHYMLFVARTANNDDLVLADATGKPLCSVAALDAGASFAWSPDGAHIAWIDNAVPSSNPAALHVLNLASGMVTTPYDQALAFFWSPDGKRLAVYTVVQDGTPTTFGGASTKLDRPAAQTGAGTAVLRIEVMQVDNSKKILVADTIPTRAMFELLRFFDQYAHALTPWSPDGRQLVLTGASNNATTADVVVAALNSSGDQIALKRITSGVVAFWSPR
jgi:Tol biopolymer transport system component